MDLKNKPFWLKIGLIGLVIGLIAVLLFNIEITSMLGVLLAIASWGPISLIMSILIPKVTSDTAGGIGIWLSPIVYFLYGAIIGLIIDKIKSKK